MLFTAPDAWTGGEFELLLLFGPTSLDEQEAAVSAVWAWAALEGPFESQTVEPSASKLVAPKALDSQYGIATLPNGRGLVPFACYSLEDSNGFWIYAGSPMGSLAARCGMDAFPFTSAVKPQLELTTWLFELAQHVHAIANCRGGAIGWLTMAEVDELALGKIPEERHHGYIEVTELGLRLHAPTETSALFQVGT
jgi:hypothetical protein